MAERLPTAAELARELADALEGANLPYAIGGAIARRYDGGWLIWSGRTMSA